MKKVNDKPVINIRNFMGEPIVTTFARSVGSRTKAVWQWLEKATKIEMAEMEHPSLKKMSNFCSRRVPIYVHTFLCRALKSRFLIDVDGLSSNGRVTTTLNTGFLLHIIDILTPEDFKTVIDTEQEGK